MYKICTDKKLSAILPRASASQCLPLFGRLSANLPPASVSSFRDPSANNPLGVLRILAEPLWKGSWGSVDLLALISLGMPPGVKKSFIGQGLWGRLGSLTQARHGKLSTNLPRTFREPSAGSEPWQIYQCSGFSLWKAVHKEKSLDSLCGRPSTKRNPLWVAVHKETCLNSLCGRASTKRNHLILFVDGCPQREIT